MTIKVVSKFFRSISASLLLIFFLAQPCLAETFSIAQDAFSVQPKQETKELKPKGYLFPILWDLSNPIIIGGIYYYCSTIPKPKPETEFSLNEGDCIGITLVINSIPYSFWTLPSDYYIQASKAKKYATPIAKLLLNGLLFSFGAIWESGCDGIEECEATDKKALSIWYGIITGFSIIEAVYHGFKVHEYNENLEKEKAKRLTLTPIPMANGVGVGLSMSF